MLQIEQEKRPLPEAVIPSSSRAEAGPLQMEEPPQPAVRGESLLRKLEDGLLHLDRIIHAGLPPSLNPFGQLGAIANTCLLVAIISGVALLIWYIPSVHQAHASLEAIRQASWLGQWVRSLHRYSSDACMFLVLLHAGRIFLQRRFSGPRWLAWTTGIFLLGLLWFVGWTGYWLVWDMRAQHVAVGSARFMDFLPLFGEPLSRSFLTDESVHSLLFFIVFFAHMLLPLVMAIALWMHLMRVNRARLFTGRPMTLWVAGSLAIMSVLLPATSASQAEMTAKSEVFTMDWWYLWPLALTDRLNGGMLWGLCLFGSIIALTLPWWMVKRRLQPAHKAQVELSRCIGCTLCASDCPFTAITMVAREDGKPFPSQAQVNPDLCVGCGICVGACDSQAINLPWLQSRNEGREIEEWVDAQLQNGQQPCLAFICRESSNIATTLPGGGELPELPGFRARAVPCAGWVSSTLIERALQRGAAGVLIAGCGEGDPVCREGGKWLQHRLAGKREPKLDFRKADPARVRFIQLDRTRHAELAEEAERFRRQTQNGHPAAPAGLFRRGMAAILLASALAGITFAFSDLPYRTPHSPEPEFVVSFNHRGEAVQERMRTQEELEKLLPHMRAQVNISREKSPVRLRVLLRDQVLWDRTYPPGGILKDGPSVATLRLPMTPGAHLLRVQIADSAGSETWAYEWEDEVSFATNRVRVLLFDKRAGFTLH